jgi:hypothetical protein
VGWVRGKHPAQVEEQLPPPKNTGRIMSTPKPHRQVVNRADARRVLQRQLERRVLPEQRRRKAAPYVAATAMGMLVLFVALAAASPAAAQAPTPTPTPPPDATAQCCDGSWSHSQHRSGTCSHHDGVCQWCPCNSGTGQVAVTLTVPKGSNRYSRWYVLDESGKYLSKGFDSQLAVTAAAGQIARELGATTS